VCACDESCDADALSAEQAVQTMDPEREVEASFDVARSTEENWRVPHFVGPNHDIRPLLDYSYHATYNIRRVDVQDAIIDRFCTDQNCQSELLPWVVFTAGAMGAGKGYVVRWMDTNGYLPLDKFVVVDPDQIRQMLPEWGDYVKHEPESAGDKTQKEAGHIAEILGYKALRHRYRVIFDGSLRNAQWYVTFFQRIRDNFPGIRIMILHIMSDKDEVIRRAEERGQETGRVVPKATLLESMDAVPKSVGVLAPYCDFCCRVLNMAGQDPQLMREPGAPYPPEHVPVNWDTFKGLWDSLDLNGDGEIDDGEIQVAISRGALSEHAVKTMDIDGNGKISIDEFKSAVSVASTNGASSGRQKEWFRFGRR